MGVHRRVRRQWARRGCDSCGSPVHANSRCSRRVILRGSLLPVPDCVLEGWIGIEFRFVRSWREADWRDRICLREGMQVLACALLNHEHLVAPRHQGQQSQAVARAWGGSIDNSALCPSSRRLASVVGTTLACQIQSGAADSDGATAVAVALGATAFRQRIMNRTVVQLGAGSDAVQGELSVTRVGAWVVENVPSESSTGGLNSLWILAGVAVGLLIGGSCSLICRSRSVHKQAGSASESAV